MKYFTITELSRSSTANSQGLNNTPDEVATENLTRLVNNVLDPLREAYGKPIKVNSGYRSPEVNKAVRGAANSQHVKGEAADITGGNKTENKILFELVQSLNLPFDQLIDESDFSWIHVSHKAEGNRGQILKL